MVAEEIGIGKMEAEADQDLIEAVVARPAVPFCENGLLSNRERECLGHLARGYTIKIIAEVLSLSPRTVEYYLNGAKKKLKRRARKQLIEFYWEHCEEMGKRL